MRLIDLVGQRFGQLVVESRAQNRAAGKHVAWHCRCDCTANTVVTTVHLRSGHTRSCGCLVDRIVRERSVTHGHTTGRTRGESASPEYQIWSGMKRRCLEPAEPSYARYGGRGITICERWRRSFAAFHADMGPRPAGTSIDRVDNNGNYEPGNCRWATAIEQASNKRCNVFVTVHAERMTLREAARRFGVKYITLWKAHRRDGLPIDAAIARALTRRPPGFYPGHQNRGR